jgi:hypothetical protein
LVTFTRSSPGTYNDATGQWSSPSTTTITGNAISVRGNPQRYRDLSLNIQTMPCLFFSPTTYELKAGTSEFVMPGDTTEWNGVTYTVRDVDPIAPDGYVIAARIVVEAA